MICLSMEKRSSNCPRYMKLDCKAVLKISADLEFLHIKTEQDLNKNLRRAFHNLILEAEDNWWRKLHNRR